MSGRADVVGLAAQDRAARGHCGCKRRGQVIFATAVKE